MNENLRSWLFLSNFLPAVLVIIAALIGFEPIQYVMVLSIIICILNIIFEDKEKFSKNCWAMIASVTFAEILATAYNYFLVAKNEDTPVVGFMLCVLYGGIPLCIMLIGYMVKRVQKYFKEKNNNPF